jgi:hypothetical protein
LSFGTKDIERLKRWAQGVHGWLVYNTVIFDENGIMSYHFVGLGWRGEGHQRWGGKAVE